MRKLNKLSDHICLYKSVLPEELCDEIVSVNIKRNEWYEHTWTAGDQSGIKRDVELLNIFFTDSQTNSCREYFFKCLEQYRNRYVESTGFPPVNMSTVTVPRINRYLVGHSMDPHHDTITSLFKEGTGAPSLTILGSLSDKEDYTGGKLVIFDDLEIEMGKGDLLIFPSAFIYPHHVTEVLSGERWSFVSWSY